MDPEVRDIMQQAIEDTYEPAADKWIERMDEMRAYNEDEAGGRFVDLADVPDEVRTPIEESASGTWTEWIDMLEARGLPGREAAEQWKKAIEDAGGEVPDGALEDG